MSKFSRKLFKSNEININYGNFMNKKGICPTNFPIDFFSIVGLFVDDSNGNIDELYIDKNRLIIKGTNYHRTKSNELMLRFGRGKLIVARAEFIHTRNGNMTKLYGMLKDIRKRYKLERIVMEQCVTEASQSWVKKNGFEPLTDLSYIEKPTNKKSRIN